MKTIAVGDRVQYARGFLRSIGAYTGEMPFAKGQVEKVEKIGSMTLATIAWEGEWFEGPSRVNVNNLNIVGHPEVQ